ncbi:N-acetyltransferase family protein [Rummeliibacillus pycnus]|uniref:GNAT family N-acetyltransferase n=1 Tax=Rummeliibacillus pycnus TaxID=101070 RepID=UPI003D2C92AC
MEKKIEKKYIPLAAYFEACTEDKITLTFSEIETIMGQPLPNASYLNKSWWKKTKPPLKHFVAWTDYGYNVSEVQLGYNVTFEKPTTNFISSKFDTNSNDHPTYIIRPIELDDAREVINLYHQIFAESDFMLHGKDDSTLSVQGFRKLITKWKTTNSGIILVAIINGEIGGAISIVGNTIPRTKHCASIMNGVLKKFANQGIGTALMNEAEKWAHAKNITRLELSVIKTNKNAISLYEKFGFTVDGQRNKSIKIDSDYVDQLYMSKIFI